MIARLFNVEIKEYSIGMGPMLISYLSKKTNIRYSLRLLPIGGYVSMVGEDEESDNPNALCNKPVLQRMAVTCAGAVINILTGVILTLAMLMCSYGLGSTVIGEFDENAVSCDNGLSVGDEILAVNGKSTPTLNNLVYEIGHSGTKPSDVLLVRDGEEKLVEDVIFGVEQSDGIAFGIMDFKVTRIDKNFINIIKYTIHNSILNVKMIWESLIDLITGRYGFDAVSGPVGVTTTIGDAARSGPQSLLYLCALISTNLGIFNLLPLPALDGGRLFFQTIELITRKKVPAKFEGAVHFAGIVLLMFLMVMVTYKDIVKLITG